MINMRPRRTAEALDMTPIFLFGGPGVLFVHPGNDGDPEFFADHFANRPAGNAVQDLLEQDQALLAAGLGAGRYQLVLKAVKDYDFDLALKQLPT